MEAVLEGAVEGGGGGGLSVGVCEELGEVRSVNVQEIKFLLKKVKHSKKLNWRNHIQEPLLVPGRVSMGPITLLIVSNYNDYNS